jgi:hypothetical protein
LDQKWSETWEMDLSQHTQDSHSVFDIIS